MRREVRLWKVSGVLVSVTLLWQRRVQCASLMEASTDVLRIIAEFHELLIPLEMMENKK